MPTFSSKPIGRNSSGAGWSTINKLTPKVRRHPVLLFGVPFVLTIVGGSYGLSYLTQTRYDYNASKVQTVSKQDELGMRKDRRKVDIREEYFRLQSKDSELDDWEPKRIARPEGVPEWGVPPTDASNSAYTIHSQELPKGKQDPFSNADGSLSTKSQVILGPDGKPCRACNSKLAFSAAMRGKRGSQKDEQGATNTDRALAAVSTKAGALGLISAEAKPSSTSETQCPPDGDDIGRGAWVLLHSVAAYYPSQPSVEQQNSMSALVRALPHLYPCHSCATALQEELQREKREKKSWEGGAILQEAVKSGPALRKWLCGLHNEVNARLGKPIWKCEENVVEEKWLTGPKDGSCD